MSNKLIALLLTICMLFCLSACETNKTSDNLTNIPSESQTDTESLPDVDENQYTEHETIDEETNISHNYNSVYDSLDLSQYDSWGEFGEDGLMWVEKSDYTGKQFGYIDYKGNVIIPFSSKIVEPGNFASGYAIVAYKKDAMNNGIYAVINTKGEEVFEFENHAVSLHYQSSNGNIVFIDINLVEDMYSSQTKDYILCSNTGKVVEIVEEACSFYGSRPMIYSDGLLRTYRTDTDTPNKNTANGYIEVITFYDENGVEALTINTNSSEYYREILYVEDFVGEKSMVYFVGLDGNYYNVQIDKSGKWINDPVEIDREEAKRF